MRSFSGTKDQDVVDEGKDIGDMAEQAGQALLENFRCTCDAEGQSVEEEPPKRCEERGELGGLRVKRNLPEARRSIQC